MRERNAMQAAYARAKGKRYAETFRCPGGALCLDFCNSGQGIRGSRQEEWIPTFADLVDWLEAAEALTKSQALRLRTGGAEAPQAAQQLFERAIAFREALARVLLARTEGRAPANEDLRLIDAEYARTAPFARLSATDDGFAWTLDSSAAELDAALRQFDLLLAVPGRNEELQPPLVRDGELRQPHEGAPPPCPAAAQRLTSATAQPGCGWLRPTEGSRRPCRDSPGSPCSRRLRKSR